jgi:hypothetical protein
MSQSELIIESGMSPDDECKLVIKKNNIAIDLLEIKEFWWEIHVFELEKAKHNLLYSPECYQYDDLPSALVALADFVKKYIYET